MKFKKEKVKKQLRNSKMRIFEKILFTLLILAVVYLIYSEYNHFKLLRTRAETKSIVSELEILNNNKKQIEHYYKILPSNHVVYSDLRMCTEKLSQLDYLDIANVQTVDYKAVMTILLSGKNTCWLISNGVLDKYNLESIYVEPKESEFNAINYSSVNFDYNINELLEETLKLQVKNTTNYVNAIKYIVEVDNHENL